MASWLVCSSAPSGAHPDRGHYVVLLDKTQFSPTVPLRPGLHVYIKLNGYY